MIIQKYLSYILVLLFPCALFAQVPNDACENAIPIPNTDNWCSANAAYSNFDATASAYGPAGCFSNVSHDLWYSFVATAVDVTVTVIGNTTQGPGGTLNRPEVALYQGTCGGTLNNVQCEDDNSGANIVELYRGGLIVGATYYIRIEGANDNRGTFRLCVNNYNPPVEPGGDCVTSAHLCDKSSFVVQSVTGAGNDPDEAFNTCLGGLGGNSESSSTWFTWTAGTSGTLTFELSPTNPADDLDFVVYELPNGINNCTNKSWIRCMASGDFNSVTSICMGPTGLRTGSNDTQEQAGCDSGDDNYLAPLDMVAGTSYSLMINNFSSTGNGFSIEFGGTGTFQGPEANFTTTPAFNTICVGESISFNDASTFALGAITARNWSFGIGASLPVGTGVGPHAISYDSPGTKSIVLTVETSLGCIVTEIGTIDVIACCDGSNEITVDYTSQDITCNGDGNGSIVMNPTVGELPFRYDWGNGNTANGTQNNLSGGTYTVTVTDNIGCDTVFSIDILEPPVIDIQQNMTFATCAGGQDGGMELIVTGATPPYLFDWSDGNGFTSNNSISNQFIGDYPVTVRDANGCDTSFVTTITELILELDSLTQVITSPSCYGFSDGILNVDIVNGNSPYTFDWNDGNGPVSQNTQTNVSVGIYTVIATDQDLCQGTFTLVVTQPDSLDLTMSAMDVSCFGEQDGITNVNVTGGTLAYSFEWSDPLHQNDSTAMDLWPGTYVVTVVDANNCVKTGETTVGEPGELFVTDIQVSNALCFGETSGSLAVTGEGGNPPYTYSADGSTFQVDSILTDLPAGQYTVVIMDAMGCTAEGQAAITQPFQLVVDVGDDHEITLGETVNLGAYVNTTDSLTYAWTPSETVDCPDCEFVEVLPLGTTTYYVEITDSKGCTAIDSVTILVDAVRSIYISNVFTPNDDGINDWFFVQGDASVQNVKTLKVFSRWGGLVFQNDGAPINNAFSGWDGTMNGKRFAPGVFVYLVEIEFIDGVVLQYFGDVTLLK